MSLGNSVSDPTMHSAWKLKGVITLLFADAIDSENSKIKLEILFEKYRNLMYHIAYQTTQNNEDAEDAVQMAFLFAFQNMEKIGAVEDKKTRSLLSIIVEHKAIDILRMRRPTIDIDALEHKIPTYLPEDGGELATAISTLPRRSQDILILRYYIGYSVVEIAQMLDMTCAAVHKSISRAKAALSNYLMKEKKN